MNKVRFGRKLVIPPIRCGEMTLAGVKMSSKRVVAIAMEGRVAVRAVSEAETAGLIEAVGDRWSARFRRR